MAKEEYDFLSMGARKAREGLENIREIAEKIEKLYGEDARLEFESGVAMVLPVYDQFIYEEPTDRELNGEITSNIGIPNTRNNSYFGKTGTGKQHNMINGKEVYIESEISETPQKK